MRKTPRDLLIWCGGPVLLVFLGAKDGHGYHPARVDSSGYAVPHRLWRRHSLVQRGAGPELGANEIAAKYVGTQFEAMGLEPDGNDGPIFSVSHYAPVDRMKTRRASVLVRSGKEEKLTFRQDYITRVDPGRASDETMKPGVLGLIDHAHTAAAQFLHDAVVRDGLTDQSVAPVPVGSGC